MDLLQSADAAKPRGAKLTAGIKQIPNQYGDFVH
jgi:hypothetical protein